MPATSDITVGGLSAKGANGQIMLTWDPPSDPNVGRLPYLGLDVVEIWAASENNRAAASRIGEQNGQTFYETGLSRAAERWYWIRCRNKRNRFGDWHPVQADLGVHGIEQNDNFLLDVNGYFVYPNGLIEQWGLATSELDGTLLVTFPFTFPNAVFNFVSNSAGVTTALANIISFNTFQLQATVNDVAGDPVAGASIYWRANGW